MLFSSVAFGLPYLLIDFFYIGVPVVRKDGRSGGVRSRDYQLAMGAMGLHTRARGAPL